MWITRLHRGFCLYHIISAVFWGGSSASALATLLQIFLLSLDVKMCLLTTNIDAGGCLFLLPLFFFLLFEGFDQSREQAPSPSPFLSLERLFVFLLTSESSSALAKALFGAARVSLSATLKCYPGDFGGNPPVISPGLTQVQPAVKSLGVWLFPLSPYGRLLLHVHDTWTYRGVFNHWSDGEAVLCRREAASAPVTSPKSGESFLCDVPLNYYAPFSPPCKNCTLR